MSQNTAASLFSKIPLGDPGSKRQKALNYLKTIKNEYLTANTGQEGDDDDGFGIDYDTSQPLNGPFDNEKLILYPSYTFRSGNEYHVEVRGLLYIKGALNRRSRVALSTAKSYVGLSMDDDTSDIPIEEADAEVQQLAYEDPKNDSIGYSDGSRPLKKSSTISSINSTSSSQSSREAIFTERFSPFLYKSAPRRRLFIQIGPARSNNNENLQLDTFHAVTNESGRFVARCNVSYEPSLIHVEASKDASEIEETVLVNTEGVSVITDIDDTIRRTGVNGDKRELLRNIFVRDFTSVCISGVVDWYNKLADKGCKFHYVSNSPWQLFITVSHFLRENGFPSGSVHLKRYESIFKGIFEPGVERKRANLYSILQDFPERKFLLIGDSGEHDLEAYVDLAVTFPHQILAIYIRDVTLPMPADPENDLSAAQYILRPDEIDRYMDRKEKRLSNSSMRQQPPKASNNQRTYNSNTPRSVNDQRPIPTKPIRPTVQYQQQPSSSAPPLPPRRKQDSKIASSEDDLIDLYNEITINPTAQTATSDTTKRKPMVPRKPVNLKPTNSSKLSEGPMASDKNITVDPSKEGTMTQSSKTSFDAAPVPPPTPPRPRAMVNSEPEGRPSLRSPYSATSLSAGSRANGSSASLKSTSSIPGALPDEDAMDYNFRIEDWKMRIARARERLPGQTRLRMWRKGADVEQESLLIIDSFLHNQTQKREQVKHADGARDGELI